MNQHLNSLQQRVQASGWPDAELRYLLDRLLESDRVIGSLTPEQWKSVASRVPPGHRKERDALDAISRLAREIQQEARGDVAEGLAATD